MQGLEIARAFYEEYGVPMLREQFPGLLPYVAAGLVGSGSECYGFDDELSRDHDFEPGFCLFLPGEDVVDRRTAFQLERAYAHLPREFAGLRRGLMAPAGGSRHGVLRISEFYEEKVGTADGQLSLQQWMTLPAHLLADATNGEVFCDPYGEFTSIRTRLSHLPEEVRRKKLAGQLLIMAQAGQYNYSRCLAHGETGAAQLAMIEFAQSALRAAFLLNDRHMPYYKWSFRALRALPFLSDLADTLEFLITSDNDRATSATKAEIIEDVAGIFIRALQEQELTDATCGDLAKHAYSVNDSITDPQLRNMNIFAGT